MQLNEVKIIFSGVVDAFGLDHITVAKGSAVPEGGQTLFMASSMIGFLFVASAARRRKQRA